jgi:ATP-binding cassette subfamily B protein
MPIGGRAVSIFNLPSALQYRVAKGTTRRALTFARPYRARIAVFVAVIIIDAMATVATPLFIAAIIDDGIKYHRRGEIILLACLLGLVLLADQILSVIGVRLSARIGQGVIFDLRSTVYRHVQRLPLAFFTRVQTGALMSRLDNDVNDAQQAFSDLLSVVVGSAFTVFASLVVMLTISWEITLVALIALPLGALFARFASRRVAGLSRANLQLLSQLSMHMSERFNVGGALLVTLFGRRREEAAAFDTTSGQIRDIAVTMSTYSRIFLALLLSMAGLLTAVVFGWGGVLASDHTLEVGTVVALATYIGRLYGPMISLGNVPVDVMNSLVSFERIFEVLDVPIGLREIDDATQLDRPAGRVVFDHVDFTYPGRAGVSVPSLEPDASDVDEQPVPVLHDVSFSLEPGTVTALVGSTGAGKTTIALLLRRLYDPSEGTVTIDDHDLRTVSFDSLQRTIGMVTQDTQLWHDTLRANLLYAAPDASEEQMHKALADAQIEATVASMPLRLDTVVGDRGFRLSGGEKQRLAIARMLLVRPTIVILDEATGQLDGRTEQAVQGALEAALHGRTALVIAHRLSTVRNADQILVLDGGRIVERGTHDGLVAQKGTYFRLQQTQA